MIDDAETTPDKIKSQIRFITTQVASLGANYAALEQDFADFQAAHTEPALQNRRGLLYADGDPIPICPYCYEINTPARRVHLAGPLEVFANKTVECWACDLCNMTYSARSPDE